MTSAPGICLIKGGCLTKDDAPAISAQVIVGTRNRSFRAVHDLRVRCWQSLLSNLAVLNDEHDKHGFHFLVWNGSSLIATARVCFHSNLLETPDARLFGTLDVGRFPPNYACFMRLVVDERFRGRGLSSVLDSARSTVAKNTGCPTILAVWSPKSPQYRRKQLLKQGFTSSSNDCPMSDGEFGASIPLAKSLSGNCTKVTLDEAVRQKPLVGIPRALAAARASLVL
jgi:GNAT superfamily N-acetyltransferase